jgi:hypothetical protein
MLSSITLLCPPSREGKGSVSAEDARLNTLKTNLKMLPRAIGLYPSSTKLAYPEASNSAEKPSANHGRASTSLVNQLTLFTREIIRIFPPLSKIPLAGTGGIGDGELVSGLHCVQGLAAACHRPFGLKTDVAGNWFRVFDHQYKTLANPP